MSVFDAYPFTVVSLDFIKSDRRLDDFARLPRDGGGRRGARCGLRRSRGTGASSCCASSPSARTGTS